MKVKVNLSNQTLEYMDSQPYIQGTDTRNKLSVYIEHSSVPQTEGAFNIMIAYALQNGRTTIKMANTGATQETIDDVLYDIFYFTAPKVLTSISGNFVATLILKVNANTYKVNVLNTVLNAVDFEAFEDALDDVSSEFIETIEALSTNITDLQTNKVDKTSYDVETKISSNDVSLTLNGDGDEDNAILSYAKTQEDVSWYNNVYVGDGNVNLEYRETDSSDSSNNVNHILNIDSNGLSFDNATGNLPYHFYLNKDVASISSDQIIIQKANTLPFFSVTKTLGANAYDIIVSRGGTAPILYNSGNNIILGDESLNTNVKFTGNNIEFYCGNYGASKQLDIKSYGVYSTNPIYVQNKQLATQEYVDNNIVSAFSSEQITLTGTYGELTNDQATILFSGVFKNPTIKLGDDIYHLRYKNNDSTYATFVSMSMGFNTTYATIVCKTIEIQKVDASSPYDWTILEKTSDSFSYDSYVNSQLALKADKTTTNDLQSQIDGINAGQNLADIVANLTALNNLDTSKLQSGDKVEVLSDSDHDNVSTVYNWSGSVWQYIGAYGTDSYTKAQMNSALALKQNVIDSTHKLSSDLVDDTNATNKFVTQAEINEWTAKQDALEETYSTAVSGGGVVVKDSYLADYNRTYGPTAYQYLDYTGAVSNKYYNSYDTTATDSGGEYWVYPEITLSAGTYYFTTNGGENGFIATALSWIKINGASAVKLSTVLTTVNDNIKSLTLEYTATLKITSYLADRYTTRHTPYAYITDNVNMPAYRNMRAGTYFLQLETCFNKDDINLLETRLDNTSPKCTQFLDFSKGVMNKCYQYSTTATNVSGDEYWAYPSFELPAGTYYFSYILENGIVSDVFSWVKYGNNSPFILSTIVSNVDGIDNVKKFTLTDTATIWITAYLSDAFENRHVPYSYITNNTNMPYGYAYGTYNAIIDNYAREEIEKVKADPTIITINVGSTRTYTKIQDAVNSIVDANTLKQYVILVDNGTYDITNDGIDFIPLKPYVKIEGQSKSGVVVSFRTSQKYANKNVFQNANSGFTGGTSEVCNMTIITENVKGALHLDVASWYGTVYFHDINIQDYASEETFDPTKDYYIVMAASLGAINLGLHLKQHVIIENVTTNGYIYSHTTINSSEDGLNVANKSSLVVKNCICDWIGIYGNGDTVIKDCVFEENKCKSIRIWMNDNVGSDYFCWNVALKNNVADFVQGLYKPYGQSTIYSLWEEYFNNDVPFADPSLHTMVQNNTGSTISAKTKVVFTDATHRYITPALTSDYDAITMVDITDGNFGVVQYGGNLDNYYEYLQTHEIIN